MRGALRRLSPDYIQTMLGAEFVEPGQRQRVGCLRWISQMCRRVGVSGFKASLLYDFFNFCFLHLSTRMLVCKFYDSLQPRSRLKIAGIKEQAANVGMKDLDLLFFVSLYCQQLVLGAFDLFG